jgi:hypothetical protein
LKEKRNLGNGNVTSAKEMIGFMFGGIKQIAPLPPAKMVAFIKETHRILRQTLVPLTDLQILVSELHHASIILSAAQAFFTPINAAMWGGLKRIGLERLLNMRTALSDFCLLICILRSWSTHVWEIVINMLQYVDYYDAAT